MLKLLLVTAATISIMAAADFTGRWTGTMETNGSRVRIFVTFTLFNPSTGGQLHAPVVTGTVATGEVRPVEIANVEQHGDELAFEVRDNASRLVKFRLNLTGGVITGEANADGQISKVSLSRSIGVGSGGEIVSARARAASGPVTALALVCTGSAAVCRLLS